MSDVLRRLRDVSAIPYYAYGENQAACEAFQAVSIAVNEVERCHKELDEKAKFCERLTAENERLRAVVEAARLCRKVGYYAQEVESGRFAGDILMESLKVIDER